MTKSLVFIELSGFVLSFRDAEFCQSRSLAGPRDHCSRCSQWVCFFINDDLSPTLFVITMLPRPGRTEDHTPRKQT